jgi:hypothetical protein
MIYISETNKNIYSIANIHENRNFFCIEYIKIEDKANFGIMIYKKNYMNEEIEYYKKFFFTDILFTFFSEYNINLNPTLENIIKKIDSIKILLLLNNIDVILSFDNRFD